MSVGGGVTVLEFFRVLLQEPSQLDGFSLHTYTTHFPVGNHFPSHNTYHYWAVVHYFRPVFCQHSKKTHLSVNLPAVTIKSFEIIQDIFRRKVISSLCDLHPSPLRNFWFAPSRPAPTYRHCGGCWF